jgi:hypothetical protein
MDHPFAAADAHHRAIAARGTMVALMKQSGSIPGGDSREM